MAMAMIRKNVSTENDYRTMKVSQTMFINLTINLIVSKVNK